MLQLLCGLVGAGAVQAARPGNTPKPGEGAQDKESALRMVDYDGVPVPKASKVTGVVQLYLDGHWRGLTTCEFGFAFTPDDEDPCKFDEREAAAACQELGYRGRASYITEGFKFSNLWAPEPVDEDGEIYTIVDKTYVCTGSEKKLTDCEMAPREDADSFNTFWVVLTCEAGPGDMGASAGDIQINHLNYEQPDNEEQGVVEVVEGGKWKRICADETFDGREAMVICRQMGYSGNAAPVVIEEASDEDPSSIYHLVCNGTEGSISECYSRTKKQERCDEGYIGVKCTISAGNATEGDLQVGDGLLSYGSLVGMVQVFSDGFWTGVCDTDRTFGLEEAKVTCQQLGLAGRAEVYYGTYTMYAHVGSIADVSCSGREASLEECSYRSMTLEPCERWATASCMPDIIDNTVVYPSPSTSIRLLGEDTCNKGRLEVLLDGLWWAPVCQTDSFDAKAAGVVCSQLGMSADSAIVLEPRYDSSLDGPSIITDVACTGEEPSLLNCTLAIVEQDTSGCSEWVNIECAPPSERWIVDDICTSPGECQEGPGECSGEVGYCYYSPRPAGKECSGGVCDGLGRCVEGA